MKTLFINYLHTRLRLSVVVYLLGFAAFTGCTYHKADIVYPTNAGTTCDTNMVNYSTDVLKILQNNTIQSSCYSCHRGKAAASVSTKLDTYTGLKIWADNGLLTHNPITSLMPKGGGKLADCEEGRGISYTEFITVC